MMLSSPKRGCVNHPDNFCYVCGKYTPLAHRVKLNSRLRYAYKHFRMPSRRPRYKKWTHIFAPTVAEQVFCFGWMVNGSKSLLLFPWCGVSREITLLIATVA